MNPMLLMPILPELWLAVWAMVMLVTVTGPAARMGDKAAGMAVFGLAGALVLQLESTLFTDILPLLKVDSFSLFTGDLLVVAAIGSVLLASDFLRRHERQRGEFYVLMVLCVLGMRLMLISDSFLTMYLGLEMMSFPLYILASFLRRDAKSSEAGLKYFVLGSLASGILLYGVSLLYGLTGEISYTGVAAGVTDALLDGGQVPLTLAVALVFVLAGVFFKLSVVPFHMWTPDVYEGAPTPVTAFLASAPKLAATALLMRLLFEPFLSLQNAWQPLVAALALVTMVGGSLLAIVQTNIKRLLAYSSIAQVGFLLVGVAAGTPNGLAGALFYLTVYMATVLGVFAALLHLRRRARDITDVAELAGLGQSRPVLALVLLVCLFSLAGVPPLAGFFAKVYVFQAALDAGLLWLVIAGVLASAVAVFYSLKMVKTVYFDAGEARWARSVPWAVRGVALVGAGLSVGLFILPQPLWGLAMQAVSGWF